MLRSFEEREHAEELTFVFAEERRFLNRRNSVRALADFAILKLGCDGQTGRAYAEVLIDAMVHGASDERLLERVRSDLDANGGDFSIEELKGVMRAGAAAQPSMPVLPPRSPIPSFARS